MSRMWQMCLKENPNTQLMTLMLLKKKDERLNTTNTKDLEKPLMCSFILKTCIERLGWTGKHVRNSKTN